MSRLPTPELSRSLQNKFLLSTPIGYFNGHIENGSLISLQWSKQKPIHFREDKDKLVQYIKQSLQGYFSGKKTVCDFTFQLSGTPAEKKVYIALMKIPYGTTITYGELAEKIGKPKSARWIGHVCSKNQLPIIIPCHRVVRKDRIGEYSAGGTLVKQWLIQYEKMMVSAEYKPPF